MRESVTLCDREPTGSLDIASENDGGPALILRADTIHFKIPGALT
jgi:hypothetical protein